MKRSILALALLGVASCTAHPVFAADLPAKKVVPLQVAAAPAPTLPIYAFAVGGVGWSMSENDLTLPGLAVQGSPKEYPTGALVGGGIGIASVNSAIGYIGIQAEIDYMFTRASSGCVAVLGCAGYSKNSWRFAQEIQWSPFPTPAQALGKLPSSAQPAHWPIPITTVDSWTGSVMFLPAFGLAERSLDACATDIAATAGGMNSTACDTRWMVGPSAGLDVRFPISPQLDALARIRYDWYKTSINSQSSLVFGSSTFRAQNEFLGSFGIDYHFTGY